MIENMRKTKIKILEIKMIFKGNTKRKKEYTLYKYRKEKQCGNLSINNIRIVQGLTEFLPISSSAHLNVFPWIFNWPTLSDGMDVAYI